MDAEANPPIPPPVPGLGLPVSATPPSSSVAGQAFVSIPAPTPPPAPPRPALERVPGWLALIVFYGGLVLLSSAGVLDRLNAVLLGVLVPTIIMHEVCHGLVANAFGDDTAKRAGRLTWNPMAHVDLFGTILLPALMVLTVGWGFGYAKPVPVDVSKLRSPRNQGLLVALAGPASNLAIVVLTILIARVSPMGVDFHTAVTWSDLPLWAVVVYAAGVVNISLGVLNLLPLPPLDGSAILERLLPERHWPNYLRFRAMAMPAMILVLFVARAPLTALFGHVEAWYASVAGLS